MNRAIPITEDVSIEIRNALLGVAHTSHEWRLCFDAATVALEIKNGPQITVIASLVSCIRSRQLVQVANDAVVLEECGPDASSDTLVQSIVEQVVTDVYRSKKS